MPSVSVAELRGICDILRSLAIDKIWFKSDSSEIHIREIDPNHVALVSITWHLDSPITRDPHARIDVWQLCEVIKGKRTTDTVRIEERNGKIYVDGTIVGETYSEWKYKELVERGKAPEPYPEPDLRVKGEMVINSADQFRALLNLLDSITNTILLGVRHDMPVIGFSYYDFGYVTFDASNCSCDAYERDVEEVSGTFVSIKNLLAALPTVWFRGRGSPAVSIGFAGINMPVRVEYVYGPNVLVSVWIAPAIESEEEGEIRDLLESAPRLLFGEDIARYVIQLSDAAFIENLDRRNFEFIFELERYGPKLYAVKADRTGFLWTDLRTRVLSIVGEHEGWYMADDWDRIWRVLRYFPGTFGGGVPLRILSGEPGELYEWNTSIGRTASREHIEMVEKMVEIPRRNKVIFSGEVEVRRLREWIREAKRLTRRGVAYLVFTSGGRVYAASTYFGEWTVKVVGSLAVQGSGEPAYSCVSADDLEAVLHPDLKPSSRVGLGFIGSPPSLVLWMGYEIGYNENVNVLLAPEELPSDVLPKIGIIMPKKTEERREERLPPGAEELRERVSELCRRLPRELQQLLEVAESLRRGREGALATLRDVEEGREPPEKLSAVEEYLRSLSEWIERAERIGREAAEYSVSRDQLSSIRPSLAEEACPSSVDKLIVSNSNILASQLGELRNVRGEVERRLEEVRRRLEEARERRARVEAERAAAARSVEERLRRLERAYDGLRRELSEYELLVKAGRPAPLQGVEGLRARLRGLYREVTNVIREIESLADYLPPERVRALLERAERLEGRVRMAIASAAGVAELSRILGETEETESPTAPGEVQPVRRSIAEELRRRARVYYITWGRKRPLLAYIRTGRTGLQQLARAVEEMGGRIEEVRELRGGLIVVVADFSRAAERRPRDVYALASECIHRLAGEYGLRYTRKLEEEVISEIREDLELIAREPRERWNELVCMLVREALSEKITPPPVEERPPEVKPPTEVTMPVSAPGAPTAAIRMKPEDLARALLEGTDKVYMSEAQMFGPAWYYNLVKSISDRLKKAVADLYRKTQNISTYIIYTLISEEPHTAVRYGLVDFFGRRMSYIVTWFRDFCTRTGVVCPWSVTFKYGNRTLNGGRVLIYHLITLIFREMNLPVPESFAKYEECWQRWVETGGKATEVRCGG